MKPRLIAMRQYRTAAFWVIIGIMVIAAALGIPPGQLANDPGPQFLPLASGVIICIAALFSVITPPYDAERIDKRAIARLVLSIALIAGYIQAIDRIGFVLSTALFVGLQLPIMGERKSYILIGLPIVASLAIYYVFRSVLGVPLPTTSFGPIVI